MSRFWNHVKKTSFVWFIVCLSCTSFQIYKLGSQYFQYDINTNVRLENAKQLIPPSAILCFETIYLIKWTDLPPDVLDKIIGNAEVPLTAEGKVDPSRITSCFPNCKWLHIYWNIFPSQLSLTTSPTHIMTSLLMFPFCSMIPTNNDIKIGYFDLYYEVTTFIRDNLKCFTLDVKEKWLTNLTYNKVRRQAVVSLVLSALGIREEMLPHIRETYYMVGPRGGVIQAGFSSLLILPTSKNTIKGVSYEEYEENLLGPPFDTWCRNYTDAPNESGDIVKNTR